MKRNKKFNLLPRTVILLTTLLALIALTAIGMFYYVFSIPEPEGRSTTQWPQNFTNSFSVWTTYENGTLTVEEIGLQRLDAYGLWIQFIDESGKEIFSHNKPDGYPTAYSASELLRLRTSDYENGNTVFVGSLEDSDEVCSYLIGFPYDIGKYMLYYNGERVARLSPLARLVIVFSFAVLTAAVFGYSYWLSRKLTKVTGGIDKVSRRTYTPIKEKGVFSEIYRALNTMDGDIRHADQVNEETERVRSEWIANITHDLKTPLSPIKGYAELLADGAAPEGGAAREYGAIILKNVNHTEKLLNDLKVTYQLESGAIPFKPRELRFARYLKELVIDLVNDPAFSDRSIAFENHAGETAVCIDPDLFRRAVQNLLINALTHNPPETKVTVSLRADAGQGVRIFISDNGVGMSEEVPAALFTRYYRGTSTKEKPEGSGLGLAIAKQIIVLHGGSISVASKQNEGTRFEIFIPFRRD